MQWTMAQADAIAARGSNLLVSAAAGSGKTAVLAERIVALVKEGVRIDDMLVVTFTRAAAAEMRARILMTLHKTASDGDRHLAAQAMRVERADISTLHGFCTQVCRDHFQAAGVDPTFRVADMAETTVLQEQAMVEALTACYESASYMFMTFAACFSQSALMEMVASLHRFLMARPDPWQWLAEMVSAHDLTEKAIKSSAWMRTVLDRVRLDAQASMRVYERLIAFAREADLFVDFACREAEQAELFLHAAEDGHDALIAFGPVKFERRPAKRKDMDPAAVEAYAALRDEAKALLQGAFKRMEPWAQLTGIVEDELDTGLVLAGLAEATETYDRIFTARKDERNLLDFGDLEHRALRALRNDAVRQTVQARYEYVFVDEYQDSSLLQEEILRCVCREQNLFMVGDVKQSIYRFRLAEPSLFLHKLQSFSNLHGAIDRKIILNANFRSQPLLLQGINQVFSHVFVGDMMELTYEMDAQLIPGREDMPLARSEVHLMTVATETQVDDDAPTAAELSPQARDAIRQEAEIIADRIISLQEETDGRYAMRDIAVLMRTVRGQAASVVEVLRSRGIPAWSDLGEDALARGEVEAMIALLRTIDNMQQDLPLLASLRGPALGLTEDSLAAIRIAQPEGTFSEAMLAYADRDDALALALRTFVESIRGWAMDAQVLSLDCLLRQIYNETGHYAQSGARPDGDIRQANLRMLAEHAGAYQRAQAGRLSGFLRYIERVQAHDGLAARDLGERDDVVRVLSIHKSKGLQYPVVFVAGMGKQFMQMDARKVLQMHAELGLGVTHIEPTLRTKRPTLSQQAIAEKRRQEALAEEARILYVAMTRAQERLILIGTPKRGHDALWETQAQPSPAAARSMLDWIVPTAMRSDAWHVAWHHAARAPSTLASMETVRAVAEDARDLLPPSEESAVAQALSWQAVVEKRRPIKQSVSSIVQADAKAGEREDTPLLLSSLGRRPLFMETKGLTATERGDAVHAFLRAAPLDADNLVQIRQSLVDRGILSPQQAKALPMDRLKRLFRGPLWQRMQQAQTVHREWPFNLRIDQDGERTLLQGVIDCCFLEEGAWVLVDYKTDRAPDIAPVLARYTPQLSLYARALETITGTPVKERLLLLIEHETAYPV